jgi:superoxide dismutase, Fe-Mn family
MRTYAHLMEGLAMSTDVSTQKYPFSLPDLPYEYDALEPYIDQQTLELHHRKHHATYVEKLNEALEPERPLHDRTLTTLLRDIAKLPANVQAAVRNNGGGHLNHDIFWNCLAPAAQGGKGEPGGAFAQELQRRFGSFDNFKKRFSDAAAKHFASGWIALSFEHRTHELAIVPLKDHEVLKPGERSCVLILDVWEHAYYLKYQNRRPDFIEAFWKVANWAFVEEVFDHANHPPVKSRAAGAR